MYFAVDFVPKPDYQPDRMDLTDLYLYPHVFQGLFQKNGGESEIYAGGGPDSGIF